MSESCPPGTFYNERTGQCEAGGGCFPGTAELSMRAGGKKKMEDLKIGDKIRTSSTSFSAILGWLDKEPGRMTNFLKLETNLTSSISLTGSHMILSRARPGQALTHKYAEDVKVGDLIVHGETGSEAEVVNISSFTTVGYYSPLTYEGTIVVDGYLTSCYASYPHLAAHLALLPARILPAALLGNDEEDSTSQFITLAKDLGDILNLRNIASTASCHTLGGC